VTFSSKCRSGTGLFSVFSHTQQIIWRVESVCSSQQTLSSLRQRVGEEGQEDFDHSWLVFLAGIDKFGKTVMVNIQYYHECNDGATKLCQPEVLDADSKNQMLIEPELGLEEQARNDNNDLSNEVLIFE
jgi:hypothetical protein